MIVSVQSDEQFRKLINEPLSLVVFGADYCGFCRATKPMLKAYSTQHPELLIGWIDVERFENLPQVESLDSLPTLVVYAAGVELRRFEGKPEMHELETLVKP